MSDRNSAVAPSDEFPQYAYDISPPPPPREMEIQVSAATYQHTSSHDAPARHGHVIRGRIENRTEDLVPSSKLILTPIQEENALTVTSLIDKQSGYHLEACQRSTMLELFSVAASPHAVVGRTYVLGFYLTDEKGGRSNVAEIMVKVVPEK